MQAASVPKVDNEYEYSQLSANGHSRKRTALLTDAFSNPRLPPSHTLYLQIPMSGHSLVSGHPMYNN